MAEKKRKGVDLNDIFRGFPTGTTATSSGRRRIGVENDFEDKNDPRSGIRRLYRERSSEDFPLGHYYRNLKGKKRRVRVRYNKGDEWELIAGRPPEDIAQIQARLVRIGVLDSDKIQPGVADTETRKAFKEVLGESNQQGMRWGDYLDLRVAFAEETGFEGDTGPTRAPFVAQLTNPETIRTELDTGAPGLIGRRLTGDEAGAFASSFNAAEESAQRSAYDAEETGGTVVESPRIEDKLIAEHKDEFKVHQLGQYAEQFIGLMGGGGLSQGVRGL